jgi:hypothetical protein
MGKYPKELLADSQKLDIEYDDRQPLFGSPWIFKYGQAG